MSSYRYVLVWLFTLAVSLSARDAAAQMEMARRAPMERIRVEMRERAPVHRDPRSNVPKPIFGDEAKTLVKPHTPLAVNPIHVRSSVGFSPAVEAIFGPAKGPHATSTQEPTKPLTRFETTKIDLSKFDITRSIFTEMDFTKLDFSKLAPYPHPLEMPPHPKTPQPTLGTPHSGTKSHTPGAPPLTPTPLDQHLPIELHLTDARNVKHCVVWAHQVEDFAELGADHDKLLMLRASEEPLAAMRALLHPISSTKVFDFVPRNAEEYVSAYDHEPSRDGVTFTTSGAESPRAESASELRRFLELPETGELKVIIAHVVDGEIRFPDGDRMLTGEILSLNRGDVLILGCNTSREALPDAGFKFVTRSTITAEEARAAADVLTSAARKPKASLGSLLLELQNNAQMIKSGTVFVPQAHLAPVVLHANFERS